MRYFIELAYNGSAYHGWQIQDEQTTVQQRLEQSLKYKVSLQGRVTGCGRTDTGVHARQFFAHFDLDLALDSQQLENSARELNSFLPADIAVKQIFRVSDGAHARFDAISRTYKYYINTRKDPFSERFAWTYGVALDVDGMNRAADILKKHTDFTSFAKLHSDVKTNKCKISEAFWSLSGGQLIFTIRADRFLRNMVRAIVGTMVEIGRGKIMVEGFREIIQRKDRGAAGMSAPAQGLFLHKVEYSWNDTLPDNGSYDG